MKEIGAFVQTHREVLLKQWLNQSLEMYPEQSRALMQQNLDTFSNPIPGVLAQGLDLLLGDLCGEEGACPEKALTELGRLLGVQEELIEFGLWIEQRTLGLFDQYMEHRERIYQLKGDEMKQRNYMLLRRATS